MKKLLLILTLLLAPIQAQAELRATTTASSGGSSGVSSITGDGVIISNSASTGAVTLTKPNAAATTVYGNPTGSGTVPSFTTAPVVSGISTAASFVPTSATIPTDGMYLAAASTLGFSDLSLPVLKLNGVAVATQFVTLTNAASGGIPTIVGSGTNLQISGTGGGSSVILGGAADNISVNLNNSGLGTWVNFAYSSKSGIGDSGVNSNCWLCIAKSANDWMTGTANNDILVHSNAARVLIGVGTASISPSIYVIQGGNVGIGTAIPQVKFDVNGPTKTAGYTVATLPVGVIGMSAYVTDQLTSCPANDATFTGGGSVVCPAFYNGTAWVRP